VASAFLSGGAGRDRTDDPLLAKQVLSQLSYSPSRFDTLAACPWYILGSRAAMGSRAVFDGGSGWIRTIDPRLIKTVL
jgi:hypothetical protein